MMLSPRPALPICRPAKQAYPIAIPYVTFAISAIEGAWDDRTGKVWPLLLAALFAVVLAGVFTRTERPNAGGDGRRDPVRDVAQSLL